MRRWWWVALAACDGNEPGTVPDEAADADADTDADSDADADADADADSDADADTGTGGFVFDEHHVLVVPDGDGLKLVRNDGTFALEKTWSLLVGPCNLCGGEGASDDGDGLLLSFTTQGPTMGGAIARLDGAGAFEWRVDGFGFPHDAERDPFDGTVIVPEVNGSRITWIAGDGSSNAAVRRLDESHPDWVGDLPNGAERFDHDGRSFLLLSHRGFGGFGGGGSGEITLWDVTAPDAPTRMWVFPPEGSLDTPHGPIFRYHEFNWWLLWAHTEGAPNGSSVGLAVTDDPTVLPQYVADLVPTGAVAPFDFLRGVELSEDGVLYLTDSGSGSGFGGASGRIVVADMPPGLVPSGLSGAVGSEQVFLDLTGQSVLVEGLMNPFEGWLWAPAFEL